MNASLHWGWVGEIPAVLAAAAPTTLQAATAATRTTGTSFEGLGMRTTTINRKSDMLKIEFEKVKDVNFLVRFLGTVLWKQIVVPSKVPLRPRSNNKKGQGQGQGQGQAREKHCRRATVVGQ